MGLLDDLKKQADLVKTQQILQQSLQTDKLKLVDDKMKKLFQYVNELLKQLAVLKPTSPLVFQVPEVGTLKDMVFTEQFIDYRRKRIGDKDYFDTIHFFIKWASGQTIVIERDMPPTAQRVRESLWLSKVKFTEEDKKNSKGFTVGAKFIVPVSVITDVTVKADNDGGRLLLQSAHLLYLGAEQFVIPAAEVSDELLEDFARALIGQPNNLAKFRTAGGPGTLR